MLSSSSSSSLVSNTTTTTKPYRQRKWFIDMTRNNTNINTSLAVSGAHATNDHMPPVGYSDKPHMVVDTTNAEEGSRLNSMRSWEVAMGPLKQAPMNVMISWMAGNSIALFPIMFVGMLLFRPFQSMLALGKAFEAIEPGPQQMLQKLTYILGNFVNLAIALYKCHSMGLLPTYASDWLAFATAQERMEFAYGGFTYN